MIKVLDCTLRDGGWVNGFNFGKEIIREIESNIAASGIEYIELGYLDENAGSPIDRSMYSTWEAIKDNIGEETLSCSDILRLVMIDYGKFSADALPEYMGRDKMGFDAIRVCFHKEKEKGALEFGRKILDKGYKLFIQPMVTSRYSDDEILRLIEDVQAYIPEVSAFYIVDSFGVMDEAEVRDRVKLVDLVLSSDIALGLHTHDNRRLCFENARTAVELPLTEGRQIIIDSSISGLGKGPGNLVTEEFTEYLNMNFGKTYDIERIRHLAKEIMLPMRDRFNWGYKQQYELTAKYHATSSYGKFLCEDNGFTLAELEKFLKGMPEDKKDSFNKKFAEMYVAVHNDSK